MTAFENATQFFIACEAPKGWAGCQPYVAEGATFTAQSEPLVEIKTVQAYCDWMYGLATVTAPSATYDLHASAYDEKTRTAIFFATYHAKHTGDGGPVPPTHKETHTDYVYFLTMNEENKVARMVKVWNAPWAKMHASRSLADASLMKVGRGGWEGSPISSQGLRLM